ncbi:MAG: toxin-antitoxin system YwqK family antitoxin [Flavobacteriaceae bacterium]
MPKAYFIIVFLILVTGNKKFYKNYYKNGQLKEAGWIKDSLKTGYWKYYYPNTNLKEQGPYKKGNREGYWFFYRQDGRIKMEGHMKDGQKANWWLFYDLKGHINHKCQLTNGIKNGYCLKYRTQKLVSAEKYENGTKVDEWVSLESFKRENNLSDLR